MERLSLPGVYLRWFAATAILVLGISLGASGCGADAAAQFPAKGIDMVVPFAAGGASDLTGRIVADYLSKKWGQPISVVNKPGGSGALGTTGVIAANPDGYTVMVQPISITLLPALQSDAPYKWDDLTPLGLVMRSPAVFTVSSESPWKSMKEIVDSIKKDPGSFKYGVSGAAAPQVFGLVTFFDKIGVDHRKMGRVVFDGGAPTVAAAAGGHVAFTAMSLTDSQALISAGKLRALAVSSKSRLRELPNVPTATEAGYPEFDMATWNCVSGPPKLQDAIVKKWGEGIKQATMDPEVAKKIENLGSVVDYQDSAQLKKIWETDYNSARSIAEQLGLRK